MQCEQEFVERKSNIQTLTIIPKDAFEIKRMLLLRHFSQIAVLVCKPSFCAQIKAESFHFLRLNKTYDPWLRWRWKEHFGGNIRIIHINNCTIVLLVVNLCILFYVQCDLPYILLLYKFLGHKYYKMQIHHSMICNTSCHWALLKGYYKRSRKEQCMFLTILFYQCSCLLIKRFKI